MPPRKKPHTRATTEQMEIRQIRILGWLQSGMSNSEIAGLEGVSRERVRQIVAHALKERQEDRSFDRAVLAEVRLTPALRLAAKAVVEGKLEGVDKLIKVIDRIERLQGPTPRRVYDENARTRLLAKLSRPAPSQERQAAKAENTPEDAASL